MKKFLRRAAIAALLLCGSAQAATSLLPGQTMHAGDMLTSANGKYELFFQGDGNLVVYRTADMSVVWNTQTAGYGGTSVTMQTDGNFVMYSAAGQAIWYTGTNTLPATLTLTDFGQAAIFTRHATWATNTSDGTPLSQADIEWANYSDIPMDGRSFYQGAGNKYRLAFQTDGNLVVYKNGAVAYASHTDNKYVTYVTVYATQLNFYKASGTAVTVIGGGSTTDPKLWWKQAYLSFQSDGNLVLYAPYLVWASPSADVPAEPNKADGPACLGSPQQCIPWIDPKYGFTF